MTRRCLRALRCHRPMRFVLDEIRPMHDELHHDFLPNLKLCAPAVASVVLTFTGPHRAVGTRARNAYYCRLPTDKEKHRGSRDTHGTHTGHTRGARAHTGTRITHKGSHIRTSQPSQPTKHQRTLQAPTHQATHSTRPREQQAEHDRIRGRLSHNPGGPEPTEPPWALGPCRSHLRP